MNNLFVHAWQLMNNSRLIMVQLNSTVDGPAEMGPAAHRSPVETLLGSSMNTFVDAGASP